VILLYAVTTEEERHQRPHREEEYRADREKFDVEVGLFYREDWVFSGVNLGPMIYIVESKSEHERAYRHDRDIHRHILSDTTKSGTPRRANEVVKDDEEEAPEAERSEKRERGEPREEELLL